MISYQRRYMFDEMVKDKNVACGICALTRAGLYPGNATILNLWQSCSPTLDNFDAAAVVYYYKENIDLEHYVTPAPTNPLLLIPTKERAIVEYLLNEKWCEEGVLIEALKSYCIDGEGKWCNMPLLYEVADFFGLDRNTLDYWIKEAYEEEDGQ